MSVGGSFMRSSVISAMLTEAELKFGWYLGHRYASRRWRSAEPGEERMMFVEVQVDAM